MKLNGLSVSEFTVNLLYRIYKGGVVVIVGKVAELPIVIVNLALEARDQGLKFPDRIKAKFGNGQNKFRLSGESLFVVFVGQYFAGSERKLRQFCLFLLIGLA